MTNKNLYNYKTPKSGNEETGFFNIKGRINRKVFFLRWLFTLSIYIISSFLYFNGYFGEYESREFIFFETIQIYILPILILIFNLIQGAKRMHDVNKSGWYFLIPLYNVYLIFLAGTRGNNDYGIDPAPVKNVQFFDELDHDITSQEQQDNGNKSGLDKWRDHLNQIRKDNPDKSYQEAVEIARGTYPSSPPPKNNTKQIITKSERGKYVYLLLGLFAFSIYYFAEYEPKHRDSDGDGEADIEDSCPYEYGKSTGKVAGCPDTDMDGVADSNDSCPDKMGNEDDGCFYFKSVTFTNNTSGTAHLSVAYKHDKAWICEGWYAIEANSSYTFDMPKYFKGKQIFWYANDDNDGEWSGSYRYFYVAKGGNSGFKVRNGKFEETGGGWAIKKGFHNLELTDENTYQSFSY
jgi:uncharacterized membrane protein YhaH (DUF805 family)